MSASVCECAGLILDHEFVFGSRIRTSLGVSLNLIETTAFIFLSRKHHLTICNHL